MVSRIDERSAPAPSGTSFELLGSTLLLKVTAADTDGAYSLVEYDAPPDQPGAPPHTHEHTEEYIFVLEGTLHVVLDQQEFDVGPSEGVLFPRGVQHSFANTSSDRVRFLTLLSPGGFESLLARVGALDAEGLWPLPEEEVIELFARYDFTIADHDH